MLFRKKQVAHAKVYFSVCPCSLGWKIYLAKPKTNTTPILPSNPKPEISIHYQSESDTELAKVTICSGNATVVMKASMFSDETRVLIMELYGYDQNNRLVVSFDEGNSCIRVAPDGMQNSFEGERFVYHCLAESICFITENQTVMEMYPTFAPNRIGVMQIKGWIYESHLSYLPYLSGVLGYSLLT